MNAGSITAVLCKSITVRAHTIDMAGVELHSAKAVEDQILQQLQYNASKCQASLRREQELLKLHRLQPSESKALQPFS